MKADIARADRGKKRVHERMDRNVAVAVRFNGAVGGDRDAAQADIVEIQPRDPPVDLVLMRKRMRIRAEADPLGGQKILPKGEFSVGRIARNDRGRRKIGGIYAAVVGKFLFAPVGECSFVGKKKFFGKKSLRRLQGVERVSWGHVRDAPL